LSPHPAYQVLQPTSTPSFLFSLPVLQVTLFSHLVSVLSPVLNISSNFNYVHGTGSTRTPLSRSLTLSLPSLHTPTDHCPFLPFILLFLLASSDSSLQFEYLPGFLSLISIADNFYLTRLYDNSRSSRYLRLTHSESTSPFVFLLLSFDFGLLPDIIHIPSSL
jgi:hypothetical protein